GAYLPPLSHMGAERAAFEAPAPLTRLCPGKRRCRLPAPAAEPYDNAKRSSEMADFSDSTIGVTGASGHLGRAVIGYLKARGARQVVGITRTPGKLADIAGIEARTGDFGDAAGLAQAFAGIDRLLVISADRIGERLAGQVAAIDAAERAGVGHVAYTSIAAP